jgi:hypothetical protein
MGKNTLGKVPHDVARRLKLANPKDSTFHSYRRTSATTAANGDMTSEQMQGFYGWKSASMCQEYISTSKPAIMHAAQTLGSFDFGEPWFTSFQCDCQSLCHHQQPWICELLECKSNMYAYI